MEIRQRCQLPQLRRDGACKTRRKHHFSVQENKSPGPFNTPTPTACPRTRGGVRLRGIDAIHVQVTHRSACCRGGGDPSTLPGFPAPTGWGLQDREVNAVSAGTIAKSPGCWHYNCSHSMPRICIQVREQRDVTGDDNDIDIIPGLHLLFAHMAAKRGSRWLSPRKPTTKPIGPMRNGFVAENVPECKERPSLEKQAMTNRKHLKARKVNVGNGACSSYIQGNIEVSD